MRLTTSPPSCAECHEIWDPKPLETLWATPGLLQDCFTFYHTHLRNTSELCTSSVQGSTAEHFCHLSFVSDWRLVTFTLRFPLLFASGSGSTKTCPSSWHLQPADSIEHRCLSAASHTVSVQWSIRTAVLLQTRCLLYSRDS